MESPQILLLSGNEAIAHAARDCAVGLGTGYPGTPSTEILECFDRLGGRAQWAPNEKVALEVGIGAAFAQGRALVTMKHVGLNVAADPLFTVAYSGVQGALVIVSADDPGMASSQNEQDNRYYARAAGVPMLEPADAQEAYDFTRLAVELSERFEIPVLLRVTTRVCHAKSIVRPAGAVPGRAAAFVRDIPRRVMIPAHARPAHRRLAEKLSLIAAWNEQADCNRKEMDNTRLGIICSGVAYLHAREAASDASCFKVGLTHPLPLERLREFRRSVKRCVVVEEGEPLLADALRAAGLEVEDKPAVFRFGELSVGRVRRLLAGDVSPEDAPPRGKPPELCQGCPHRKTFEVLKDMQCIVAGDIGCYTLGALPPYEAMDSQLCMGASIGMGLGMRHTLPEDQARRVISVIGDSTFMHSGITGLVEANYNLPATGHVILILDNDTTAMTGLQEHPATGRRLDHSPARRVALEDLVRALGADAVHVVDPQVEQPRFRELLAQALAETRLTVFIVRRPCMLGARRKAQHERAECANNG